MHIEYARFTDDLVILVDEHPKWQVRRHLCQLGCRKIDIAG
jgi:hypothetical protein